MDEESTTPAVDDEFHSTLHSAPSFEIYNTSHGEFGDADDDESYPEEFLKLKIRGSRRSSGEFSFGSNKNQRMDLIEEAENERENGVQNLSVEDEEDGGGDVVDLEPPSPPMYLAAGLGVDAIAAAGVVGFDHDVNVFNQELEESADLEGHYRRMVDEYPNHPLILKKYAQILQSKGDLEEAEEYFYRATLADPNDGEALMEYARILWEHHHDKDRASGYYERAIRAAPTNSYVLAAHASFLWETDDDDNESRKHETQDDKEEQEIDAIDLTADNWSENGKVAEYLKKKIDANPNNPLFLKKYAQLLVRSKDLEAAEDYYSRAVLADPGDGEMISEYAKLEWELHHDQEKASTLFEQAVRATPENSNVLAAYTCFLWETEDGDG